MTEKSTGETVLVTGASGFIATHCIHQLLEQGYNVRGTLRTMSRENQLRSVFAEVGGESDRLQFFQADLQEDGGWDTAAKGCDYVLHIASPVVSVEPKDENELIAPAHDGTLRVLRAAAANGVKRTVLTSSTDAVNKGRDSQNHVFDESDWSNLGADIGGYSRSKTLAEQAAWDFVNSHENGQMEMTAINPVIVLGPLMDGTDMAPSLELVRQIMDGAYPAWANLHWEMVDVRDVAAAHLSAMTKPDAAGKRYCCYSAGSWMPEMAAILNRQFETQGYKIPTRRMPDFVLRGLALFNPDAKRFLYRLNTETRFSTEQAQNDLDWQPRGLEEMLQDSGDSLIANGFV